MEEINIIIIEDQITAQDIAIEAARQHKHTLYLAIGELWVGRDENMKYADINYRR